jgi:hypothetical protein
MPLLEREACPAAAANGWVCRARRLMYRAPACWAGGSSPGGPLCASGQLRASFGEEASPFRCKASRCLAFCLKERDNWGAPFILMPFAVPQPWLARHPEAWASDRASALPSDIWTPAESVWDSLGPPPSRYQGRMPIPSRSKRTTT